MTKREQVKKERKPSSHAQEEAEVAATSTKKVDSKALSDEMDEILDEIDSVLESNAEEFVRSYVQKGGQLYEAFGPRKGGEWCKIGTWNQKFNVPSVRKNFLLLDI